MRIRKKPWAENELSTNSYIVQEPESMKGRWAEYFGNDNPVFIEIGCGKGRFISLTAKANPEYNFIGIERDKSVSAVAVRHITDQIDNLCFICADAGNLENYFEEGEVNRIYLNFSDPWPRKKWAKRRLTYKTFLAAYKRVFGKSGEIHMKTDNRTLFEFSLNEFSNENWRLRNISLDLHNSDYEGNIMTEYEEKFSSEGLPIYRLEAYYND
ncbi:MAG: tRNA (guanosine(46)-N7)-methyltransferase TrmB [Firmicutes bacterium]|nr:tRNA (guanosine(46)-N7)-methyltransferase TrmB [Bacillota bacterium]